MTTLSLIFQIIIALAILKVWIFTRHRKSIYRGGNARTLREEFSVYRLPLWFMTIVGTLKVTASIGLLVGIWYPTFILPSAVAIAILMLGAISMHIKVRDSFIKAIPATTLFLLSVIIIFLNS